MPRCLQPYVSNSPCAHTWAARCPPLGAGSWRWGREIWSFSLQGAHPGAPLGGVCVALWNFLLDPTASVSISCSPCLEGPSLPEAELSAQALRGELHVRPLPCFIQEPHGSPNISSENALPASFLPWSDPLFPAVLAAWSLLGSAFFFFA